MRQSGRSGVLTMAMRAFLVTVLLWLAVVGACAQGPSAPLTGAEEITFRTLKGQLADPTRSAATKTEAAGLLLSHSHPQAERILNEFLNDSSNRQGQVAVADAVARLGAARKSFIEPLLAMLTGTEPSVRSAAAVALATYKNNGVTEKLIAIAKDAKRDRAVRLVTISALGQVLDKKAADTLVGLLDDPDTDIRDAAAEALGNLTNIRAFGADADQWKRWWKRNKDKDHSVWLADLADNLARENARLKAENANIRERLAKAMMDLYGTTSPAQRDAMLMSFLKDSLVDVRLVGLAMIDRRTVAGESVSVEFRSQVRDMLADADGRVRVQAALAIANMSDSDSTDALLSRLAAEEALPVREALLRALGQMREARAIPAVLGQIDSEHESVAAAAAAALGRIVTRIPLETDRRTGAIEALVQRYGKVPGAEQQNGAALRESLLTAMGAIGDKAFLSVLTDALKDTAASVRQAAVNGLAQLGQSGSASAISPLMADPDRGVRQTAIRATGALNGEKHLRGILQRTDPAAETDAGVRQQAWETALNILADSDARTLSTVIDDLSGRPDASDQRIKIMETLAEVLKAEESTELCDARRKLAAALVKVGRSAEAVPHFAEAYKLLVEAQDPGADAAWLEWVAAMLVADDPATVKTIADQQNKPAFTKATVLLVGHLRRQSDQAKWAAVVALSEEAIRQLPPRLDQKQRTDVEKLLDEARPRLRQADAQYVAKLAASLTSPDEPARKAADDELQELKNRAIAPLLNELRKCVDSENANPATEKAILKVLRQIAPGLNGYDPSAAKADRLKVIDAWMSEA